MHPKSFSNFFLASGVVPLFSHQIEYNLFDRFIERQILPYCCSQGLVTIAYSPLNKAMVPFGCDALESMSNKYNMTLMQIALNWLIRKGNVIAIAHLQDKLMIFLNRFTPRGLNTRMIRWAFKGE